MAFGGPIQFCFIESSSHSFARPNGLTHIRDVKAFVSKVMVFDKPVLA
jgi:hypothetical protein